MNIAHLLRELQCEGRENQKELTVPKKGEYLLDTRLCMKLSGYIETGSSHRIWSVPEKLSRDKDLWIKHYRSIDIPQARSCRRDFLHRGNSGKKSHTKRHSAGELSYQLMWLELRVDCERARNEITHYNNKYWGYQASWVLFNLYNICFVLIFFFWDRPYNADLNLTEICLHVSWTLGLMIWHTMQSCALNCKCPPQSQALGIWPPAILIIWEDFGNLEKW